MKKRIRLPSSWQHQLPGRELLDFVEMVTLTQPDLEILTSDHPAPDAIHRIQECLRLMHSSGKLLLPNLSAAETVSIFSDYGGEHKGSRFHSYSFLVCAHAPDLLQSQMAEIREKNGLNSPFKEISYKTKNYGPVKRAMPEYLAALNSLVIGGVFTFLVDKKIETLFAPDRKSFSGVAMEALESIGMQYLQADVAEKLFRVVHFSAYLTSLLANEEQKIFWMTDHDAIAANSSRHNDLLKVFERVLRLYKPDGYKLLGGAVPFAENSAAYLDLLSVPDLVAGATEHFFTNKPHTDEAFKVPAAVDHISKWLAGQGVSLKKHTFMFEKKADGVKASHVDFSLRDRDPEAIYIELSF